MAKTKRLTAACHCQKVGFTLIFPKEYLPLKVHLCHCSICRHFHGAPYSFHAPLPSGIVPEFLPPTSLDQLTAYEPADSQSKRYFRSTCGCNIGDQAQDDDRWVLSNSIFDANREDQGNWEFATHLHSNSAADGGLSVLVPMVDGRHCGGVSFDISRPKPEF